MIKLTGWVRVWFHCDGTIQFSSSYATKKEAENITAAMLKYHPGKRRLIGIKKVNIIEGVGLKNYKFPTKETKPIPANDNDPMFMSELLR